jgi:hypothetical protein
MNITTITRRETCPTCKCTQTKEVSLEEMTPTLSVTIQRSGASSYKLYYEPSQDNDHPFWVRTDMTMDYTNSLNDAIKSILKHKHLAGQQGCIEVYSDYSSMRIHSAVNSNTTGARFDMFAEYIRKALYNRS